VQHTEKQTHLFLDYAFSSYFPFSRIKFWREPAVNQTRKKSRRSKAAANKIDAIVPVLM